MMAELRDYQQELLERAESALQSPDARVMLQLPTGGGKTHIAGALLAHLLQDGRKAVWLTHRKELAHQTRQMLEGSGVTARDELNWSGPAPYLINGATILMAQTVGRRINKSHIWGSYNSNDLLVVDEAHHAAAAGYELSIEQWPGRVIGLTATPWRLSEKEGFDDLFKEMICGPQIHKLQADDHLCQARLLTPPPDDRIMPGNEIVSGEYTPSGIEEANSHEIMTVRAVDFWKRNAADRQTIVYAVSKDHARRLADEFKRVRISAAVILSDTPPDDRAEAINGFANGDIQVLVNMSIVTEGFDLPGDSCKCVVITRPTMSLALYLQMVGRGLRPKKDGGNCLILDLAGNSEIHGLPEDDRQWSLEPRGNPASGEAPVVRCERCDGYSPAGSLTCVHCAEPFGKSCPRCGKWRAWKRWSYEAICGDLHEVVCDLCHYDAHIDLQLSVPNDLLELALYAILRTLQERERDRTGGTDEELKNYLLDLISKKKMELSDNTPSKVKAYISEEISKAESRLAELEGQPIDEQQIFNDVVDTVMETLGTIAEEDELHLSKVPHREESIPNQVEEGTTQEPPRTTRQSSRRGGVEISVDGGDWERAVDFVRARYSQRHHNPNRETRWENDSGHAQCVSLIVTALEKAGYKIEIDEISPNQNWLGISKGKPKPVNKISDEPADSWAHWRKIHQRELENPTGPIAVWIDDRRKARR